MFGMQSPTKPATTGSHARDTEACRRQLRIQLATEVTGMQARAPAHDRDIAFPADDIELLRRLGALTAPVPTEYGGLGLGTEPKAALDIMDVLRLIGRGNLSVGRLYEAHVNVLRLVTRYGTRSQRRRAAAAAQDGRLFGLWVTDASDAPVVLADDLVLHGAKSPCSGAGYIQHALVTAQLASGGTHMLLIELPPGQPADKNGWPMQGMRAACNGCVSLEQIAIGREAFIGDAGAYLRQPEFSAGAWRGMAVALGGMEALIAEQRRMLRGGRAAAGLQRARTGESLIALETARMWVRRAALLAECTSITCNGKGNWPACARTTAAVLSQQLLRHSTTKSIGTVWRDKACRL